MNSRTFLRRVREGDRNPAVRQDAELFTNLNVRHTIGKVSVRGTDLRIGISHVTGFPIGRNEQSFFSGWRVTTALMHEDDPNLHIQQIDGDAVPGSDIARIPAGNSPWLPDDAMVAVARGGEMSPTVYLPVNSERLRPERFIIQTYSRMPADL